MRIVFFVFILAFLMGCNVQKRKIQNDWISLFKNYATYKCICEATDNKLEKLLWSKKDISFSVVNDVLGVYSERADSIGRSYAKNIKSINVDPENDLYGRKQLFSECLNFYKSNHLNKVAKSMYQQFRLLKRQASKPSIS